MVDRKFTLLLLPIAGACLLSTAGCASSRSGPFLGEKFDDPPQLSPYNQPLSTDDSLVLPDQQTTGYRGFRFPFFGPSNGSRTLPQYRSQFHSGGPLGGLPPATPSAPSSGDWPSQDRGPIELGQPTPIESQPTDDLGTQLGAPRTYQEESVPTYPDAGPQSADDAGETIRQRPDSGALAAPVPADGALQSPAIGPASQSLDLQVNDPRQATLAEAARFEVVIRNASGNPVEDVVIVCQFDEGLNFPGLPDRALRQRLGTLGPSESRTIDLSLTAEQVGRHCVDFTLTATGCDDVLVQRCVQVIDPQTSSVRTTAGGVGIELVGPATRNAGGRLECVLTIQNRTGQDVSGIVATIHYDAALVPQEASAGALRRPGALMWDLGLLRTDERVQIQMEFSCPTPTEHACIDAELTGRDVPTERQEVCVVVRPRPTLDVAIADARDPVPVGETTTYLVTLTNRGLEAMGGIRVDVDVDGGLEILSGDQSVSEVSLEIGPQSGQRTASYTIAGPIEPDETRQVRVDVRGTAIGTGGLRVLATELATNRRVNVEEPTVVNPPLLHLPSFEDIAGGR